MHSGALISVALLGCVATLLATTGAPDDSQKPAKEAKPTELRVKTGADGSNENLAGGPTRPNPPPTDVTSYQLEAQLDEEKHVVSAQGTIQFNNPSEKPTNELYFHLYLNAFENEDTLFLRKRGGRSGGSTGDFGHITVKSLKSEKFGEANLWQHAEPHSPGDPQDRTDIRVALPGPILGGESVTFEIEFSAKLPRIIERTGYEGDFHMLAQWFPKLAKREKDGTWAHFAFHPFGEFYADFGSYKVVMEVPEHYVVGSTGSLKRLRDAPTGRLRYLAEASHVHDFAWTAWPHFKVTEKVIDGVKLRLLAPFDFPRVESITWKVLEDGLAHFGEAYGEYPHPVLTVVQPPRAAGRAGGMEYPQLITTGGNELVSLLGIRSTELLTIHELGHQWFQGLVATNEMAKPFLDEGLTSYAEWEFGRTHYGHASAFNSPFLSISREAAGRYFSLRSQSRDRVSLAASEFSSFSSLASLVYSHTALCLATLARVYGEEKMTAALGHYARKNRFSHPGSDEFYAAIEEFVGSDARQQAELVLERRKTIDLKLATVQSSGAPGSLKSKIEIEKLGALEFPFEVLVIFEDGDRLSRQLSGKEKTETLEIEHSAAIKSVCIDPERRVLLDENFFNNRRQDAELRDRARLIQTGLSLSTWALLLSSP